MGKDLNQCNFIGRLGKPPEQRFLPSGQSVASFSMAVGDDFRDKQTGEKVERTNWINVVMFGKTSEIAVEYLKKGSRIHLTGKLTNREWEHDGQKHYKTEIVCDQFQMLDSREASSSGSGGQQGAPQEQQSRQQPTPSQQQNNNNGFDDFDDDIPF